MKQAAPSGCLGDCRHIICGLTIPNVSAVDDGHEVVRQRLQVTHSWIWNRASADLRQRRKRNACFQGDRALRYGSRSQMVQDETKNVWKSVHGYMLPPNVANCNSRIRISFADTM